MFQVSPTKKQPGVDRTGREERSERAWRAAPSAVLDPAPSAVVRQLSISAVLRGGVGDAPTRPPRVANASAEPAYRHPGESKRGPSAVAARLRTTGSSAIATPLPTRPPTGDDDADDADADADEEAMANSVTREIYAKLQFHALHRGVSLACAPSLLRRLKNAFAFEPGPYDSKEISQTERVQRVMFQSAHAISLRSIDIQTTRLIYYKQIRNGKRENA